MDLLLEKRRAGITVRMILAPGKFAADIASLVEAKAALEAGVEIKMFRPNKEGCYVAQTKDVIVDQSYVLTGCIDHTQEDVDRCSGSCHRRNEECIIEAATACWEAMWDAAEKYTNQDAGEMILVHRRTRDGARTTLRERGK